MFLLSLITLLYHAINIYLPFLYYVQQTWHWIGYAYDSINTCFKSKYRTWWLLCMQLCLEWNYKINWMQCGVWQPGVCIVVLPICCIWVILCQDWRPHNNRWKLYDTCTNIISRKDALIFTLKWSRLALRKYGHQVTCLIVTLCDTVGKVTALQTHFTNPRIHLTVSCNTPHWNRNVNISVPKWCIVGYRTGALCDLWDCSIDPSPASEQLATETCLCEGIIWCWIYACFSSFK